MGRVSVSFKEFVKYILLKEVEIISTKLNLLSYKFSIQINKTSKKELLIYC